MSDNSGVFLKKSDVSKNNINEMGVAQWKMISIPSGSFSMEDSTSGVVFRSFSPYKISNVLVTQQLYTHVMGLNPSQIKGANRPVESVSWFDAIIFCNRLSRVHKKTCCYKIAEITNLETIALDSSLWLTLKCDFSANGFRLPTEAEWEYAARAGSDFTYAGGNNIDDVAWYGENAGAQTHDVGTKKPNAFGLYDMNGNVAEWCWDWFGTYETDNKVDSHGPASGKMRVKRGGSWLDDAIQCTVNFRSCSNPNGKGSMLGFRICCKE